MIILARFCPLFAVFDMGDIFSLVTIECDPLEKKRIKYDTIIMVEVLSTPKSSAFIKVHKTSSEG